jgi:hypothetical protein
MKVAHAESHVKGSSGLQDAKSFSIRTNAHAFKMLSSGLYSDKIGAVLREIACNAMDAHIDAKKPDLPIEVKIPNRIDRQFHVRDWGPGLAHEDVMELYTSYFTSTKQTSNDFTGAFGLGSKSPFSYTDSFVVTSVHGGKKRTYTAHIGDQGIPTIAQLTTEKADDDWPSGLMVAFPVQPGDYEEFQRKALSIFRWFRVTPKVLGMAQPKKVVRIQEEPGFFLSDDTDSGDVGLVMGNVRYPVVAERITGLTPLARQVFNFSSLNLKAKIGDVQVAGSREELQYDPKTIAWLVGALEGAARTIVDEAANTLRAFHKASWEDKCKTRTIATRWMMSPRATYYWAEMFQVAGLADAEALSEALAARSVDLPAWAGDKTSFRVMEKNHRGQVSVRAVTRGLLAQDSKGHQPTATVQLEPSTTLYHGEVPHALPRIRKLIEDGSVKQAIMITPSSLKKGDAKDVAAETANVQKLFPGMTTVDVATVPLPQGFKPGAGKKARVKKGATLPPLPSTMVPYFPLNKQKATIDISQADPHYMVTSHRGNWLRAFEKTLDADHGVPHHLWVRDMSTLAELQGEINMQGIAGHVIVDAAQVRLYDLPKRGWRPTFHVVKEWLESAAVRQAVAANAAKWRPTIDLRYGPSGWIGALIRLMRDDMQTFERVVKEIKLPDLRQNVVDIFAASKAAGSRAGMNTPLAIAAYNRLLVSFGVKATAVTVATRSFLDISDLEQQILTAFPLMNRFTPDDALHILQVRPGTFDDFMKFIQT